MKRLPEPFVLVALCLLPAAAVSQTISKGNQILINQGLQVQGMVSNLPDDPFHLNTYQAANYTAVNWIWDSNTAALGTAPGAMPWARWVRSQAEMPPRAGYNEAPYTG